MEDERLAGSVLEVHDVADEQGVVTSMVRVDVSGEPYLDLKRAAATMIARE